MRDAAPEAKHDSRNFKPDRYDQLEPGRRRVVSLPQAAVTTAGSGEPPSGPSGDDRSGRFTAAVLDVDAAAARQAARDCAVFIVPQVCHVWLRTRVGYLKEH